MGQFDHLVQLQVDLESVNSAANPTNVQGQTLVQDKTKVGLIYQLQYNVLQHMKYHVQSMYNLCTMYVQSMYILCTVYVQCMYILKYNLEYNVHVGIKTKFTVALTLK